MEYREHFDPDATEEAVETAGAFALADVGDTAVCTDIYVVQPGDTYYGIAAKLGITVYELSGLNPYVDPDRLQIGQQLCIPMLGPTMAEEEMNIVSAMARPGYSPEPEPASFEAAQPYVTPMPFAGQEPLMAPQPMATPTQMEPPAYQDHGALAMPEAQTDPNPVQPVCPEHHTLMRIPSGWTFYNILMRYGISYEALGKANPGMDLINLVPGQMICIPPAGSRGLSMDRNLGTHIVERSDTLDTIARRYRVSAAYLLQINPNLAPDDFIAGRVVCVPN